MFTTTQIGAVTLFALASSQDVLGLPLLTTRQASNSSIGNFGSCSIPQIEFGVGFDNRKETSFQPVDKTSFNHGSAQNIDIISQFICDTLTNSCGADATAKATCAQASTAADGQTAKTGAQADAFNAVFGITTNFAAVPEVSDQGVTLGVDGSSTAGSDSGATSAAAAAATTAAATGAVDPCPATVTVTVSAAGTTVADASTATAAAASAATTSAAASSATSGNATSAASSSSIGNFGSCSVPQIEFGVGFDNRKETSFQPVDKTSFNHGSAQNIDVITQFICDTLTNSCGADATAKATCAQATTAADGQTAKTGAQADAFNAVFGITTNFASVPVVSDTGVTLGVDGSATAAAAATAATA